MRKLSTRISSGFVLMLTFLACALVTAMSIAPLTRYVERGSVARSTIRAPFDVLDPVATEEAEDIAEAEVQPVYTYDEEQTNTLQEKVNTTLLNLDRLRADADSLRRQIISASPRDSELRAYESGSLAIDEWGLLLDGEGIEQLMATYGTLLEEHEIFSLLALNDTQYTLWLRELTVRLNSALRAGIPENKVAEIKPQFLRNMTSATPISIKSVLNKIADQFLQPTMFFDEMATERAITLARRNVAPVYIAEGEVLVDAGETIDEEQYSLLSEAGYGLSRRAIIIRWFACVIAYLAIGIILFIMALRSKSKITESPRNAVIFGVLVLIALLSAYFLMQIDPYINLSFLGIILIAQLVSIQDAFLAGVLIAPAIGILSGGRVTFDYYLIAQGAIASLFASFAGINVVRRTAKRSRLILGGLAYAAAMSAIYIMFASLKLIDWALLLHSVLYSVASGLVCSIIALGVLPVWEWLFDVATPTRLMELSDINHPLLQRLMLETPGTYNHVVLVGSLAENCANAINADPVLARVGAYFHDIGKLRRPLYFSENKKDFNPHDELDPYTSAAIIKAHVSDGLALAKQYKLPSAVRQIIAQHHGDSIVTYFYAMAIKESGDTNLAQEEFRYVGPRPQSREAAIVMICDSIEAAIRSLDSPNSEQVKNMIDRVMSGKFSDGQFCDSRLSFADVEAMKSVILNVYDGALHERVQYPDVESLKKELSDSKELIHS